MSVLDTKDTAVNKTKFLLSCVLNSSGVLKTGETKQKYIGHKAVRESGPWETGNKWSCLWLSPLYCLETISRLQCWKQAWQTLGLRWQRYRFWEVGSWSFWERILKRASYRQNSIDLQGGPLRYLSGYWTAHVCEETIWGWRKKESPEMIREIGTSTYQGPGVVFASSQSERPHNSPESTQESL